MFKDDPSIPGDESLFRRITPSWVNWDDEGNPTISSAAFRDKSGELSVLLESVMVEAGRPPAEALGTVPGFGLAAITAAHARAHNLSVARDPQSDEPAHGVVCGELRRVCQKVRDGARWVIPPTKFAKS